MSRPNSSSSPLMFLAAGLLTVGMLNCQPAESPQVVRSPVAQKWLDRAQASFRTVDLDDAQDAASEALRAVPDDPEIRLIAANLALARLDFADTVRLTEGLEHPQALAIRGRALWYAGDVKKAGAVLEALLRDPEVKDPWAKAISKLANLGAGRTPYRIDGSIVAAVEMPHLRGASLIVPVEIDGEQGLAMIATATAEVVLDSAQRKEPAWVSVRIGERVEFHDVPAVTQDLSGLSRQLGAPVKALLGVNFLRHANPTFDFEARQFVVRRFAPPRPPAATDVPLHYIRGGGMIMRGAFAADASAPRAPMMIDTSSMFPLTLDNDGWHKAGVNPATLTPMAEDPSIKQGTVPLLRIGQFDLPQVAGVLGKDMSNLETSLGLDIDGVVGAGLLAGFRVTLGDGGRLMWVEEDVVSLNAPAENPDAEESTPAPPGSSGSAPATMPPAAAPSAAPLHR